MNEKHIEIVSKELKITSRQVLATAALIEGGATVPFIARYRKEWTGELDEVAMFVGFEAWYFVGARFAWAYTAKEEEIAHTTSVWI